MPASSQHLLALMFLPTLLFLIPSCLGAIYSDVQQLPNSWYDFIIVGGGTAGLVVANRLTENRQTRVLVLEAGGSNTGVTDSICPFLASNLVFSEFDWNYLTVPQSALNDKICLYTRGRILGGSSSLNYMFYTRGSSEDFDRYAGITSDPGWSWNNIQQYIRKNEKWSPPVDNHNTAGQYNPIYHSNRGLMSVSLPGFPQTIDNRIIQTTQQLNEEFPFVLDMNGGRPLGVGWLQSSVSGQGERSSSATSYLTSDVLARPNLDVLTNAQVTRLLPNSTSSLSNSTQPAFRTVEFVQGSGATRQLRTASKEVILSAGTINTPVILMNSGIGDRNSLNALGITPRVHLPSVGQNLSDQANTFNVWTVNSTNTDDNINQDPNLAVQLFQQWQTNRSGRFVDSALGNQIIWSRVPGNSSLLRNHPDPSPGPNSPHFEIIPVNGFVRDSLPPTSGHYIGLVTIALHPVSRGSIQLASNNPLDPPRIDPALLADDFDLGVMREAVKSAQRFMSAPAWKDYVLAPLGDLANAHTDEELNNHIRNSTASIFHPLGSCQMSASNANYGVVNPDLKVKGMLGLRIVDGSVIPRQPSGHPQAVIYIFAERGADLIKASWGL